MMKLYSNMLRTVIHPFLETRICSTQDLQISYIFLQAAPTIFNIFLILHASYDLRSHKILY